MDTTVLIGIIVVLGIAVVALVAALVLRKRRSEGLRKQFGPEYDRTLRETPDQAQAEAELEQRRRRVERLRIRPLAPNDATRFRDAWRRVQARFVDDPKGAVTEADQLIGDVMSTRGYPVADFNQRASDISVDHPQVVEHYRAGHDIALRHARGDASTEDLRQCMIHYRTLFLELVGEAGGQPETVTTRKVA